MGYIMTGVAPRKKRQLRSCVSQVRLNKRLHKNQVLAQREQEQVIQSLTDKKSILERFPLEVLHKIFVYVGVEGNNMYYMSHYFKLCLKPTLKLKLDVIQESFISDLNERVKTPTLEDRIHRLLRVYEFEHQQLGDICKNVCLNPNRDVNLVVFQEATAFGSHLRRWRYAVDSACLQYKFVTKDVIGYLATKYGYLATRENIEQEREWRSQRVEKLVKDITTTLGDPISINNTTNTTTTTTTPVLAEAAGDDNLCEHLLFRHQFRKGYLPQRFWTIDTEEKLAECQQLFNMGGRYRAIDDPLKHSLNVNLQVPLLEMAKMVYANSDNRVLLVYSVLKALEVYKNGYQGGSGLFEQLLEWYCSGTDGVQSKHEIDMVWRSLMEIRNVKLTEMFMDISRTKLGFDYGVF